ncbi:SDR family oxidoreductase [Chryseolinea sp. H1M3-3]|uniref:SDR family oxidoreductase n=1 Tax=Chryseolinea sp. H1M3-3 TaxID=3034144 RepID=UPI0023ED52EA|nr:SDR family oxidoreductase [Chryseolinea sp. H1M3-3]
MEQIKNKVILITGGSKGIGYGVAEALVKEGAKVAITSRSQKAAQEAAEKLNKIGNGESIGIEADVRNAGAQQKTVDAVVKKWGSLDVLVANAGLGHFGNIETLTIEQWNETIDTNLTGVFYSIKACIPALKKSKGYIITMASLAGTNFFAGASAYNASKFGLVGFTQAAMLDLRSYGIKVATIMPGSVATEFSSNSKGDESWKIQPEDIGQIVVDLLQMNPRTLPSKIEVRPSMPK